ncbi:MAG TPA: MarR family transcriptional regulator [Acidobacteriaceae bacterium]|jgi:DNA-binding MarR family transcriptional regulator|nr:MarR family transcriptional regulator [Acidobacteriaceae bacterium]
MSTKNRAVLHETFVHLIRRFIAGSILYNQQVADQVGLRLTDMQCMNVLEMLGRATPGQLAKSTGLTTGGVTVMLDRLEKAAYIRRVPNPKDRRSVLIEIRPEKMKSVQGFYEEINKNLDAFLAETPETDLRTVVRFFTRMNTLRTGGA